MTLGPGRILVPDCLEYWHVLIFPVSILCRVLINCAAAIDAADAIIVIIARGVRYCALYACTLDEARGALL